MTRHVFTTLLVSLFLFCTPLARTEIAGTSQCSPTQIHLSFGDDYSTISKLDGLRLSSEKFNDNQAYLVWETQEYCDFEVYIFTKDKPNGGMRFPVAFHNIYSNDSSEVKEAQNATTYKSFAYTAFFERLDYETPYQYEILDSKGSPLAGPFSFTLTTPNISSNAKKILFVGNIDTSAAGLKTITTLSSEVTKKQDDYAGIIQLGNILSNIQEENGTNEDSFFQNIQDITSRIPFIMTGGNQDDHDNWNLLNYRLRNPMFNITKNQYFSFNLQGIHFVGINFDYYAQSDFETQEEISSWVERDLTQANDAAHRAIWPWIVVFSHQPVYCSSSNEVKICSNMGNWEELFHKHSVDLMISGSSNTYQRLGPLYQNQSISSTQDNDNHNITDATGTIYVVEGTGGSKKDLSTQDPSYGTLYAVNSSSGQMTLRYEHYNSKTGELIDFMNIIKTKDHSGDGISGINIMFKIIGILTGAVVIIAGLFVGIKKWRQRGEIENDKIPLNTSLRSSRLRYNRPGEKGVAMVDLVLC